MTSFPIYTVEQEVAMTEARNTSLSQVPDMLSVRQDIANKLKLVLNNLVDETAATLPLHDLGLGDECNNMFDYARYFVWTLFNDDNYEAHGAIPNALNGRPTPDGVEYLYMPHVLPDCVFAHRQKAASTIQKAWKAFAQRQRSARTIQKAWELAAYDMKHALCRSRLQKKIADMMVSP